MWFAAIGNIDKKLQAIMGICLVVGAILGIVLCKLGGIIGKWFGTKTIHSEALSSIESDTFSKYPLEQKITELQKYLNSIAISSQMQSPDCSIVKSKILKITQLFGMMMTDIIKLQSEPNPVQKTHIEDLQNQLKNCECQIKTLTAEKTTLLQEKNEVYTKTVEKLEKELCEERAKRDNIYANMQNMVEKLINRVGSSTNITQKEKITNSLAVGFSGARTLEDTYETFFSPHQEKPSSLPLSTNTQVAKK